MDLNRAIELAQLVNAAYGIAPTNLTNSAGTVINIGVTRYVVVTTIYASDLKTDMNPARGNHKRWDNKILLWSFEKLASFSALPLVGMISPHPVLFIAGTKADSKSHSEIAFGKAKEPKELYWIEGATHFDLYDGPEYTKQVATKLASFFTEHIGGSH